MSTKNSDTTPRAWSPHNGDEHDDNGSVDAQAFRHGLDFRAGHAVPNR